MPALAEGLLLFGEVDVLGASGANSGHLGSLVRVPETKIKSQLTNRHQHRIVVLTSHKVTKTSLHWTSE